MTTSGQPITLTNGKLNVPNNPIIPFIEGDGTGPDIWRASQMVFDAAVNKAYNGQRSMPGKKSSPARRRSRPSTTGCPTKPSKPSARTSWASRAR
jgi:hypothetical protein